MEAEQQVCSPLWHSSRLSVIHGSTSASNFTHHSTSGSPAHVSPTKEEDDWCSSDAWKRTCQPGRSLDLFSPVIRRIIGACFEHESFWRNTHHSTTAASSAAVSPSATKEEDDLCPSNACWKTCPPSRSFLFSIPVMRTWTQINGGML